MGESLKPTFVTITWRSSFKDEKLWVKLGSTIQQQFGMDVLMHLTCHLPKTDLQRIVRNCREAGIRNILALRGDPPIGESVESSLLLLFLFLFLVCLSPSPPKKNAC